MKRRHKSTKTLAWYHQVLVTGCGIGYMPLPGTMATLAAAVAAWMTYPYVQASWPLVLVGLGVATAISLYSVNVTLEYMGERDPSYIVIDEILATVLLIWALPYDPVYACTAVIAFRFFDGTKVCGLHLIELLDRGWGVLGDDLFAALYSLALITLLQAIHVLTPLSHTM